MMTYRVISGTVTLDTVHRPASWEVHTYDDGFTQADIARWIDLVILDHSDRFIHVGKAMLVTWASDGDANTGGQDARRHGRSQTIYEGADTLKGGRGIDNNANDELRPRGQR